MRVESLVVAAAENAAVEWGDRRTLAVGLYSRRVLGGHGLARRAAEAVSWPSAQAWIGDLLAVGGAIAWACIALGMRATPLQRCSSEQVMIYQLGVSAVLLLVAAPLFGDTVRELTWSILAIFAFQVVAVASIGYLLWARILAIYPVGNMASFSLLAPVFGVFSGWLLFDDPLTLRFVIALSLVGTGLLLMNWRRAG